MLRWLPALLALTLCTACDDEITPGEVIDDAEPRQDAGPDEGPDAAACTPSDEICNGVDDDCDEAVDEAFETLGTPCTIEQNGCTSEGAFICADDGSAVICDAAPPAGTPEICDGADNDCDGAADEDFDLRVDEQNCGMCGRTCELANAEAVCVDSDCGISACAEGFRDANGTAADGCECAETNDGTEACDAVDNDCDGTVDEGFAIGEDCVIEEGTCSSMGQTICGADGAIVCDAPAIELGDELCNGRDDDCDGMVDEDFDGDDDGAPDCGIDCDAPCPEGIDCDVVCAQQDCAPEDPTIYPGAREICEDGIDQNCNGRDIACAGVSAYVSTLAIANGAAAGCRDFTGDGVPDNSFGAAGAFANGSIQSSIDTGNLSLLPTTFGLGPNDANAVFDLALLFGRQQGVLGTYSIRADSYAENGDPRMFFPDAQLADGAMQAGPGDFFFDVPVLGVQLMLDVNNALLTGDLTLEDGALSIENGWITGVIPADSFQAALGLLPPEIRGVVQGVIRADVDTDDDGVADGYSVCLSYEALPATLVEE